MHVVQNYWRAQRVNPQGSKAPGWFIEGLADYVHWFLYEPESRGALLSAKRLKASKHDASYRVSANFIDWVTRTHGPDVIQALNSAARKGKYSDRLWETHAGKPVAALADDWRKDE